MPDYTAAEGDLPALVPALLRVVRDQLGLDVGMVCEVTETREVFHVVESRTRVPFAAGESVTRRGSLGELLLNGSVPRVCGDLAALPAAAALPGVVLAGIGSAVAAVVRVEGRVLLVGALGIGPRPELTVAATQVLGAAVAQMSDALRRAAAGWSSRERIEAVLAAGGPAIVAQPIVDLVDGTQLGVEALSRFGDGRSPDRWYAEAHACGLGVRLELAAARRAALLLDRTCGAVGINLSVTALADPEVLRFLAALPVSRVVVELTEHEAVADYDTLSTALAPLRRRGMSLAVDDAGAGFASLRHVLRLAPDWIKVDQTIVRSADTDPARAALLEALVVFARGAGMQVLAEGVETAGEAALVRQLGMHSAQGWYFGHPAFPDELPEAAPVLVAAEITRLALPRPRAGRHVNALAEPLAG